MLLVGLALRGPVEGTEFLPIAATAPVCAHRRWRDAGRLQLKPSARVTPWSGVRSFRSPPSSVTAAEPAVRCRAHRGLSISDGVGVSAVLIGLGSRQCQWVGIQRFWWGRGIGGGAVAALGRTVSCAAGRELWGAGAPSEPSGRSSLRHLPGPCLWEGGGCGGSEAAGNGRVWR